LSNKSFALTRIQAIKVALEGIKHVMTTQPNARIHAGFTLAVFFVAGLLKLPRLEWVILLLTVGLVWAAEVFNTAIEIAVDVVSPNYDPKAKIIKDISAGAVLISVLVSILVGLFIFGPYLWNWIKTLF
jgi:diacylglycerol kinase